MARLHTSKSLFLISCMVIKCLVLLMFPSLCSLANCFSWQSISANASSISFFRKSFTLSSFFFVGFTSEGNAKLHKSECLSSTIKEHLHTSDAMYSAAGFTCRAHHIGLCCTAGGCCVCGCCCSCCFDYCLARWGANP
jgi:hypothetical protein